MKVFRVRLRWPNGMGYTFVRWVVKVGSSHYELDAEPYATRFTEAEAKSLAQAMRGEVVQG